MIPMTTTKWLEVVRLNSGIIAIYTICPALMLETGQAGYVHQARLLAYPSRHLL
jgi:hypothetical protein